MSVHRKLIHRILFQILQHFAVIRLGNELIPGLLGLHLCLVLAGAAHTGQSFHKLLRKTAHLHEQKGLLALCGAIAPGHLDVRIFIHLL